MRTAPGGHVPHAETHRLDAVAEEVVVVAIGVPPLLFWGMTGLAVELDAQPVPLVVVVEVANATGEVAPRLPASTRQALRALDVADLAALQGKHDTLRGVVECFGEP